MSYKPAVVPISSLADAASIGVDLAMEERASIAPSDPTNPLNPGTTGLIAPPPTDPTLA